MTFDEVLGCLYLSKLEILTAQLDDVTPLLDSECKAIVSATRLAIRDQLLSKLTRLLVVEVRQAKANDLLPGEDRFARWNAFAQMASHRSFWEAISCRYPDMLQRVDALVDYRCEAALEFARRWAKDKKRITFEAGRLFGSIESLTFSAGDSHHYGRAVAIVSCENGKLVYKPRSLDVDKKLHRFLSFVAESSTTEVYCAVPEVIDCDEYGWAQFIDHEYAESNAQVSEFYCGVGQCLAIMHLLGGNDFHAENVIANRGRLTLVDCETLFAPMSKPAKSDLGDAVDRAMDSVGHSVLGIGLLPTRGGGLGWRGVDISGVGSLADEQPVVHQPGVLNEGTDEVYIGDVATTVSLAKNHPTPQPQLSSFWHQVLEGFDDMITTLRTLDQSKELEPALDSFRNVRIRYVPRATEAYSELSYMLWHPVSLHAPDQARAKAYHLLSEMSKNSAFAPDEPQTINTEINELCVGDIPLFSALVGDGRFTGPKTEPWRDVGDLLATRLDAWRSTDFDNERQTTKASLVSAYINDGWLPEEVCMTHNNADADCLRDRARAHAAEIMRKLSAHGIFGDDGTVTWIAPSYDETGWSVRPLGPDLYGGIGGVALLTKAYIREMALGRADPVEGLDQLHEATARTLDKAADNWVARSTREFRARPLLPGGFLGLGSLIYVYLTLDRWAEQSNDYVDRACEFAYALKESCDTADSFEVLTGSSGALLPLIELARRRENDYFLNLACDLGKRLCQSAESTAAGIYWPHPKWPRGIGGFAHGVSGVAWALHKLAEATQDRLFMQASRKAFAFEDNLFDKNEKSWTDLRGIEGFKTAHAWCHGSAGIGLARLDCDPSVQHAATSWAVRQAATANWKTGMGWNFCICHGDLGNWELLQRAIPLGLGPPGLTQEQLLAHIVTGLDEYGPVCGIARDTFTPGLMAGEGGVAYQLLRSHPEANMPSVATLESDSS